MTFLRDDLVYQTAVGACASRCVGLGGVVCATTPFLRDGLCSSRLWARARAGVLVLAAVCEDVRADADAAADGDATQRSRIKPPVSSLTNNNLIVGQSAP